jgi:putative membrane protein
MEYPHWLLVAFGVLWLVLAIRPHDRVVWLTENVMTAAALLALVWTHADWPVSDLSYSLVFVFLVLHTIGAHYTYARVPYFAVAETRSGITLIEFFGWTRNHYDRLVHFAYGLLIAYPAWELLERYAGPAAGWSYFLAPALIMATSMAFEVIEWWAAELLGGPAGSDYVGAQGDPWDAQKDMALATGGSIIAMLATAMLA